MKCHNCRAEIKSRKELAIVSMQSKSGLFIKLFHKDCFKKALNYPLLKNDPNLGMKELTLDQLKDPSKLKYFAWVFNKWNFIIVSLTLIILAYMRGFDNIFYYLAAVVFVIMLLSNWFWYKRIKNIESLPK